MAFDLAQIRKELQAATAQSAVEHVLAVAVVADIFRLASLAPPTDEQWKAWQASLGRLWPEQLAMLAHCLMFTSLREQTLAAAGHVPDAPRALLDGFFAQVAPLSAEMIRNNGFRQEEFLRKWIAAWGGSIAGEPPEESVRRLDALDYRRTLDEYKRAEQARASEKARRLEAERIAREAAEKEAAARGWRE